MGQRRILDQAMKEQASKKSKHRKRTLLLLATGLFVLSSCKPAEPPKRATPPVQSAPQENVFRDSQTGKLWRQLPDGRYEEVTQPPPVPGKKTSFIEGRLYRDPTTGVMKVYRNGQFV